MNMFLIVVNCGWVPDLKVITEVDREWPNFHAIRSD